MASKKGFEICRQNMNKEPREFYEQIKKFQEALQLIIKLAEVQSTITRLATEIQSTKRRVNALKNIVIPRFDSTIRWISLTLGEQEREEFVRLKKVKARLEAKEESQ